MSDLIKQAKEYADLSEVVTTTFYDDENEEWSIKSTTIRDVLDTVCDDYTVFPSTQQWIPVTKRLPKLNEGHYVSEWVLCSDNEERICFGRVEENVFGQMLWNCERDGVSGKVVAWMPLPEPWEGKE